MVFPQVFLYQSDEEMIVLREVYNVHPGSRQIYLEFGTWDRNRNKRLLVDERIIWERRSDLQGYEFSVVSIDDDPYSVANWENGDESDKIKINGICGDVWHGVLEKALNFTTNVKPSPDGMYGSIDEDGTWNGIIGSLQNTQVSHNGQ